MKNVIIVKYGEISLKGMNRPLFENQLIQNLRFALRDIYDAHVIREHGRIRVETDQPDLALPKIARTFGVVGASFARAVPLDLASIQEAARHEMAAACKSDRPCTFKVEARRANKAFPIDSPHLNSTIGAYILQEFPNCKVDVHQPQTIIRIEVREKAAYVYSQTLKGPGGLPAGSSSQGLLLLSGGIDSPVAGWLAMRRGIRLNAVHFHSHPYTSERAQRKVLELAEILACYAGDINVHMVGITAAQTTLKEQAPPQLMVILLRRLMFRIATHIANDNNIPALITGESVGQVASQTLESMAVVNAVTHVPVLRPLITADKSSIVALAKQIGTYEVSVQPYEDCCTLFVPKHPATKPDLHTVEVAEEKLDYPALIASCLDNIQVLTTQPHPAAELYTGGVLPPF